MSRLYKNAPLHEAICEIRFSADSPWDLAMPGLIYEVLKNEYPERKPARSIEAKLIQAPDGLRQELRQLDLLQFSDQSGSQFVRVGQHVLLIHNVGQYPGWKKFFPRIQRAANAYAEVVEPKSIERVGLRFVNKIRIPGDQIDLSHYFCFYPQIGDGLPQEFGAYMMGVEFPFDERKTVLRLQLLGEVADVPAVTASRLDLDYFSTSPGSTTVQSLAEWLQTAHERIEKAFESSVTDKLRVIFDEDVKR